ncbi:MAG TPA: nucleoside-diphosphate sugar epimerase [Bacilli bacterium]
MEQQVTSTIKHMANSHQEMARILEAKRDMVVHLANLITQLPDMEISFKGLEEVSKNSMLITENITSYLIGLAEFEEAIAENLSHVMKELIPSNEGE